MLPDYSRLNTAASLFLQDGSKVEISRHTNNVSVCLLPAKPKDGDPWSGTHLMLSADEAGWIGQQLDLTIQTITNDPHKEPPKQAEEERTEPATAELRKVVASTCVEKADSEGNATIGVTVHCKCGVWCDDVEAGCVELWKTPPEEEKRKREPIYVHGDAIYDKQPPGPVIKYLPVLPGDPSDLDAFIEQAVRIFELTNPLIELDERELGIARMRFDKARHGEGGDE